MKSGQISDLIAEVTQRDPNADLFVWRRWIRVTPSKANDAFRCWLLAEGFGPGEGTAMVREIQREEIPTHNKANVETTELFRKSSQALGKFATQIVRLGFLNSESESPRVQALLRMVKELKEMSKQLKELAEKA
jgi:hypothetical protein